MIVVAANRLGYPPGWQRASTHPFQKEREKGWGTLSLAGPALHHFLLLCTFARLPAGAFLFNLV